MSSNLIKIVAGVFVLLAVILGFWAWKIGHDMADNSGRGGQQALPAQGQQQVPQTQVVVAIKPILAKQPIDKDSVKVVALEIVPSGYYTDVKDVIGYTPLIDIAAGTPITPELLKGNPVAKQIPAGSKAVSLTLTDVIGVGGFVRPGDIVDVLVFLRNDQQNKVEPTQARILQKDALVLAFDDHVINPPLPDKNQSGQPPPSPRHERTVVVAVPDSEVTRVMLGANMGEVRLALHGQALDQAAATTPPATGAAAPSTAATAAAAPTPVSGASLAPEQSVAAAPAAAPPAAGDQLPDQPYTSAELGKLKPQRASKGAPQGIVIYRGSKASTVYP